MSNTAVYPSTLNYRARTKLNEGEYYEYSKLYNASTGDNVWGRLCKDAKLRQGTSVANGAFQEGAAITVTTGYNSGFCSNTKHAVYTHDTFRNGAYTIGVPVEQQHNMLISRQQKRHPVDYFVSARPEAETINQTMRMYGTYENDYSIAHKVASHIPHMCPGGRSTYHPDVTSGQYGLKPTLPRRGMGATLGDGRNLK